MLLLTLDTASAAVSVAVHDGERVLAERSAPPSPRHAELLAPMITDVLAGAGASAADVTAIGAGAGPGPFTGLRVGLVTARMLGHTLGVEVHGVCSLDVVATGAVRAGAPETFLVAIDARRREVYWARYVLDAGRPWGWRRVTAPAVSAAADIPRDDLRVAGRGAALWPAELLKPDSEPLPPLDPAAGDLARVLAAALRSAEGGAEVLLPPDPLYLRRPDAQRPGAPKRVLR